ncbi:hypothetical protein [uncultured Shewanella sp.]|uniref:hypothetical protein n=1 Tax=uncultured Shewanella sp. TaxID=173975 RepID=UPI00261AA1FE|nr:hypothetical protein [uncultured Shewanella sp.]
MSLTLEVVFELMLVDVRELSMEVDEIGGGGGADFGTDNVVGIRKCLCLMMMN